jgi:8-oxo-dGTP pyrophosphatase MutT (NUDIX family)
MSSDMNHLPITQLSSSVGGASAAILLSPERKYLLQHRDNRNDIWDPDQWGLFGGAIDPGESPADALARELVEELELRPTAAFRYFTQIAWDYGLWGHGVKLRYYYEVKVTDEEIRKAVQHEGQGMRFFSAQEILREPNLTAYDAHALRMHIGLAL